MNNKLTQEYKDDLYGKVLEKKRVRNIKRKKMLSIFIVFISVVGFTTLGFSLLEKEDYKNFFISETENITFNDEYEYFDDLGIKLEFINIDKNSLTLGINIKYENIADYDVDFEELYIEDLYGNKILYDDFYDYNDNVSIENKIKDYKINNNSEIICFLKYELSEKIKIEKCNLIIKKVFINNKLEKQCLDVIYRKQISIEE